MTKQAVKITKTTLNFAERRKLKVVVDDENKVVYLFKEKNKKRWLISYEINNRGLFFKKSYLPQIIKEELPYWIETDQHHREVIDFIGQELKKIASKN
ncbi:hypothetical protein F933_03334 [Acinetobacter beijerinckii CIP 110307]|uniref:Uncharacterized protein n=2 Tax=Acinetobacter beijerinckii TaxID=262668 RepID=N9DXH5_9GAMM|nr:hypothetical protein F933_03334 [Acinetobacter beijerinckii CIP 110307]